VTATADVGFDLEEAREPAPLEIAPRYFSRRELAELHRLPPARQTDRFYALWTFKESYIKGRGLGLAIPLDSFTVEIDSIPRGRARLVVENAVAGDDGGAWTLRGWRLERHAMALAVRAASDRVRVSLSMDQRIGALFDRNGRR
jgi:4'-phosphopantetheinyl transferase